MNGKDHVLENQQVEEAMAELENAATDLRIAEAVEEAAEEKFEEAIEKLEEAQAHAHPVGHYEHEDHETETMVIINASPHEVTGKELTYKEVVDFAYNNAPPTGPNVVITVTYSRGENGKSGTMLPGDSVKIKSRMVFDVSATDRS